MGRCRIHHLAAPLAMALAAILSLAGCGDSDIAPLNPTPATVATDDTIAPWFAETGSSAGFAFTHDPGPPPPGDRYFMPQVMGSGAALFDYDNDGRLDVYLLQNAGPNSNSVNRLYHQEPDGRFADVTAGSGVGVAGFGMGVAAGDVNNDGLPDLAVTEYAAARLFLNRGGGRFAEVTGEAGIDNPEWGASCCFVDYD